MGYSVAFKNKTKFELEREVRRLNATIKTLKSNNGRQAAEIEQLENDNKHLKGAVTSLSERLEAVTKERDAKKNEAGDWHNKYDGKSYELEGVRGALKREAEMRTEAKKKCDELCEKLVKMGNEFEAYRKSFNDKDIECSELRDKAWKWDKIHGLVDAHGIDTMSKLKDALVELEHKREDVESLKTSLADSCAAKIKEGRDLTAKIESLERELCSAKEAMARDAEEAHKLRKWYDNLKKLYDKARKEGEEGCAMWREDAWKARDDRDFYKKKAEDLEHVADDQAKQIKALVNKRDELQDRVNILAQRWTDKFNPEDELFGRKISEWQEYDAVLVKYGVPSPKSLDAKLDPFDPDRLTAAKSYHVMKNWCVNDEKDLDDELGLLSRYRDVMEKYGVGGPEELDKCLDQRQRMNHTLHVLKKDIEQFNRP